jgi:hypothetical protein
MADMTDPHKAISRRQFIQTGTGIAAMGLGALNLAEIEGKAQNRRPNVLYIFSVPV